MYTDLVDGGQRALGRCAGDDAVEDLSVVDGVLGLIYRWHGEGRGGGRAHDLFSSNDERKRMRALAWLCVLGS